MKKIFSIIGLVKTLFFVLFLFANLLQAQDWIKNHPGIPLETGLDWDWIKPLTGGIGNTGAVDSMKLAGVDIVRLALANNGKMDTITNWNTSGFRVLPFKSSDDVSGNVYNYIQHYTDAKYSVWEAEGSSLGNDDAQLVQKDAAKTEIYHFGNSTLVRRIDSVANSVDTLTEGPYYVQDVHYYASQGDKCDTVRYKATFSLMLQNNSPAPPYNPSDTICVLQVTYSINDSPFHLDTTIIIEERIVRRNKFDNLDVIDTVSIDYDLADTLSLEPPDYIPDPQNTFKADLGCPGLRDSRDYIQFKVIWKGKSNINGEPQYLLSFDKVIVSDERGMELKTTPIGEGRIWAQDDKLLNYAEDLVGWMGIDEPVSIDIFEPIRIVQEVLAARTNNARPLRIPFMGSWSGYWDAPNNIFGAMGKSKWKVFGLRVGETNIIQNFYMYDYPYRENGPYDPPVGETINEANIRVMAELNYKQSYELDPNFGVSIQCGANNNDQSFQRNIKSHELLYNVNLALMYGAKFIELWNYFAQRSVGDSTTGFTFHGIVDWESNIQSTIYTDKYFTLKDTISPRLKGLMGKTLKTLTPTEQILNAQPLTWHNYINLLIHYGDAAFESGFDLGFFKDVNNLDYFMLINRWYNAGSLSIPLKFTSSSFGNYNNIQLYNLIDESKTTILNNGVIYPTIVLGDALLYRVAPVVRSGGTLVTNETTLPNEILYEDMTIENGTTLTVNGTYNAKASITVKNGGKIVAGPNGKIIFDAYKKLMVEGTTEIKGSSPINKLTLEFVSSEKGIDVLPSSSLTLSYCNITGAYYGLVTRTGTPSYLNITHSNFAFGSTGIVLNGNFYGEGSSPSPTSTISGCNFTTWGTGISVSNNSSVIVSQNNFTSCGISILNVPAAYIQSNSIYSGSNESYSGIFFNNSGGYIRNNTIKNRVNGIFLANSSTDIGNNLLENNYKHGLYIGSGSIPNLVGLIQTNPPTYYPLAGYNTIRNNGNDTRSGGENDGSEIYFSYSDAHLGTERNPGCNQISDDRTSTSSMNTIWLLNGNYGNEPHFLDAIYNYWGTTTPTSSRFGIATNFNPYYTSMCSPNGGGEQEKLVLKTSSGEIVDSISAAEGVPESFTTLEENYSIADNLFATGNVTQAKPLYEQIVSGNYTTEEKLSAYNKLYTIANLTGEGETYFNNLQSTFDDIASIETDTLIKKIYQQNAIKCDVSKEEYLTAISKFDNIIQQNPNSEEAIYAEIDILTTALNIDTTNSQLGKMGNGKYLVKGTSDYLSKLNDILQSKFGINSEEKEQIIPEEYSLYQNYPNPFNPVTTIKFDIPNDGLITLEIFDILGRRIATLVNDYKPAGSYEQVFNASTLASGVYVYKLQAGDFISSKKMILLK